MRVPLQVVSFYKGGLPFVGFDRFAAFVTSRHGDDSFYLKPLQHTVKVNDMTVCIYTLTTRGSNMMALSDLSSAICSQSFPPEIQTRKKRDPDDLLGIALAEHHI